LPAKKSQNGFTKLRECLWYSNLAGESPIKVDIYWLHMLAYIRVVQDKLKYVCKLIYCNDFGTGVACFELQKTLVCQRAKSSNVPATKGWWTRYP
jgi:hypothetical protein